ncbi:hypothetical protein EDC01DRAFT_303917 [Geopyxis carbonaria]|nr:hypothetical protein EDC01DRAFT_303917 [Geopyxis carbonaria]
MASRQSGGSGGAMTDTTVGNYRIGSEIGRGSFAVVFKGHHMKNKSLAAIKVVQRSKLSRKLLDNLESEIQILKKLNHPHIVALPDCKKTDKYIHLIMEYCSVSDLSVIIRKREKLASVHPCLEAVARDYPSPPGSGLNEVLVRHFVKQLASALEFLRKDGLVHRDVKPQNLLLNPPPDYESQFGEDANMEGSRMLSGLRTLPVLKLADFGFARVLPATSMAETLCGSPLYMAPEILRYEKYDATADLWSVGTVLYEMATGRPPFRAPNHVELLRKIETRNDRIDFPSTCHVSEELRGLIRSLLKRNPVERMSFQEFFNHPVITSEIPGVKITPVAEPPRSPLVESVIRRESGEMRRTSSFRNRQTDQRALGVDREARSPVEPLSSSPRLRQAVENSALPFATHVDTPTGTPPRRVDIRRNATQSPAPHSPIRERQMSRPVPTHAATAPTREELVSHRRPTSAAMERVHSRGTDPSPGSSLLMQNANEREYRQSDAAKERRGVPRRGQNSRELRNSGEDDYVFVDKQQVQVNAFADELATARRGRATPPQSTALVRKPSSGGTQSSSPRPMGVRNTEYVAPKGSYERRYGSSPGSAKSTLAKALELANLRLFGVSLSPPNQSPPAMQSPFPPYVGPGSLVLVGNGGNMAEEDMIALQTIEESASRSDVVYNFAEVKFAQLIPAAPTSAPAPQGLGLVSANEGEGSLELTPDATILAAEECLVLFVKVLQLLSKATDIAHAWWAATNQRTDALNPARIAASTRMNNVVQWIRERFNEVLDKAEIVQQKIIDAQKDLPLNHPSHPNNQPSVSDVSLGSTKSNFMLTTGVTAEKLMYDRAIEMSRASAVNELVGEDLQGCEGAYVTAMRLLEAVLERRDDDEEDMDQDDTKYIEQMLVSIRARLSQLRTKLAALSRTSKRSSVHSVHGSPHMHHPPSPGAMSPSPSPMLR